MGKENKIKVDMKEIIALHSIMQTIVDDIHIPNNELLKILMHSKTMLYKTVTEKIERGIAKEYYLHDFEKYCEHRDIADTIHKEKEEEYKEIIKEMKKYKISKMEGDKNE